MKIRRVKAISYKEFIHLFRDIRSLMVIILVPVILLILFGYALKLDVENVKMGVVDFSDTPASRDYIERFNSTNAFNVLYELSSYEEAERLLDTGKVKIILVVGADFSKELEKDRKTDIQVIVDGSDITTASSIINYISGITALYNEAFIEGIVRSEGVNISMGFVSPEVKFWFNEDMRSVNYLFPGLIAIILSVVSGFLK
ncbi:MAG: ABC transporter permease [Mucispirillum sp.]|nr:ABC transporter permease [Mucispirillum sp.]